MLAFSFSCSSGSSTPEVSDDPNGVSLDSINLHLNEEGDPGWLGEDINEDGIVNVLDMIVFAQGVK